MPETEQYILARLYTDGELRKQFLADEENFFRSRQLCEAGIRTLKAVSKEELEYFSRSLLIKRMEAASGFIPGTAILLKEKLRLLFFEFASSRTVQGTDKHYKDAADFLEWLQQRKAERLIKEMAMFELCLLYFSRHKTGSRLLRVHYNLPLIRLAALHGRTPPVEKSPRLLFFKRGKLVRNFPFL